MKTNDRIYYVYAHINKINSKMYIGQTRLKPEDRWRNGVGYKACAYFYKAIQKYGWDGFEHEIIASHLTKDEADNFEKLLIAIFNTTNPINGYNLKSGGHKNSTLSEETKRKIGDANKGKKLTDEHKQKLIQAHKGSKHTEETKRKISQSHMKQTIQNFDSVCLSQYDKSGILLSTYNNVREAQKATKISVNAIDNCLCGRSKSAGGFIWRYVDKNNIIPSTTPYDEIQTNQQNIKNTEIKKTNNRRVYQYDKKYNLIQEWSSITEAAYSLQIGINNIWKCCNHLEGRKTAGGFLWEYSDELLTQHND